MTRVLVMMIPEARGTPPYVPDPVGPLVTPWLLEAGSPHGSQHLTLKPEAWSQHVLTAVCPEGHDPPGPASGRLLQASSTQQKHLPVTSRLQKQPNGPDAPQLTLNDPSEQSSLHGSSHRGVPAAKAGVRKLESTGALHAMAAPAPIRFRAFRREIRLTGCSSSIQHHPLRRPRPLDDVPDREAVHRPGAVIPGRLGGGSNYTARAWAL